jgi:hypothetical protein
MLGVGVPQASFAALRPALFLLPGTNASGLLLRLHNQLLIVSKLTIGKEISPVSNMLPIVNYSPKKPKGSAIAPLVFVLVAGVGFEPTTSGL